LALIVITEEVRVSKQKPRRLAGAVKEREMARLVLVTGAGLGKTFLAEAMMNTYAGMPVKAKLVHPFSDTKDEAAQIVKEATTSDFDVVLLVTNNPREEFVAAAWQEIRVSGGRPIFETGRPAVDTNKDVG
jgi:hypothetical protein